MLSNTPSNATHDNTHNIYTPPATHLHNHPTGITCHFCRQKKLCGEPGCPRCSRRSARAACIGKTECARCHGPTGRFCRACLQLRYGQTMEAAQAAMAAGAWLCPHCYEEEHPKDGWMCNSSICMKRRGFKPTGIAIYDAQSRGFKSVAHWLQAQLLKRGGAGAAGAAEAVAAAEAEVKEARAAEKAGAAPAAAAAATTRRRSGGSAAAAEAPAAAAAAAPAPDAGADADADADVRPRRGGDQDKRRTRGGAAVVVAKKAAGGGSPAASRDDDTAAADKPRRGGRDAASKGGKAVDAVAAAAAKRCAEAAADAPARRATRARCA